MPPQFSDLIFFTPALPVTIGRREERDAVCVRMWLGHGTDAALVVPVGEGESPTKYQGRSEMVEPREVGA
jgi:hypothetical protein